MDSSRFEPDIEQNGSNMTSATKKQQDGRKKVLVVGAGAAGYVTTKLYTVSDC